ncbi:MAG: hypothetical protein H0U74_04170 [Bradymonadaceae bacterium]|nr:hypothetical protein [Lujinxingiaceae bacterium]
MRMIRLVLLVALMLASGLGVGCSSELDPTKPEHAYLIFRNALFEGDAATIWQRSDQPTHEYFQTRYEQLVQMGTFIETYLPQTDHRLAKRQSGAELTDMVSSGQELFLKVFQPALLPGEEPVRFGSEVQEIQMSEDGAAAVIVTRSEQQFLLAKAADNQWYVSLVESGDVVETSFKWLDQNESALKQTVEDLIAEERKKREAIIAELMNVK